LLAYVGQDCHLLIYIVTKDLLPDSPRSGRRWSVAEIVSDGDVVFRKSAGSVVPSPQRLRATVELGELWPCGVSNVLISEI